MQRLCRRGPASIFTLRCNGSVEEVPRRYLRGNSRSPETARPHKGHQGLVCGWAACRQGKKISCRPSVFWTSKGSDERGNLLFDNPQGPRISRLLLETCRVSQVPGRKEARGSDGRRVLSNVAAIFSLKLSDNLKLRQPARPKLRMMLEGYLRKHHCGAISG